MPSAGELKLSATGISGVGEVDAHLRFGETGRIPQAILEKKTHYHIIR